MIPWPNEAVIVVCPLATDKKTVPGLWSDGPCFHCGKTVSMQEATLKAATSHPDRTGRPIWAMCRECYPQFDNSELPKIERKEATKPVPVDEKIFVCTAANPWQGGKPDRGVSHPDARPIKLDGQFMLMGWCILLVCPHCCTAFLEPLETFDPAKAGIGTDKDEPTPDKSQGQSAAPPWATPTGTNTQNAKSPCR